MVVITLLFIVVLAVFFAYGNGTLWALRRFLKIEKSEQVEAPLILISGLCTVTAIAMIAHLFMPLGDGVFMVALILFGVLIMFISRDSISPGLPSFHILVWMVLILMFTTIVENSTHIPSNPDTGLYHAQTIRWFETYRIVQGLGNLESRYAFNSSWLVLNASLSFVFLGLQSFRLVNGVTFLIASFYFVNGLSLLMKRDVSLSALLKVMFLPLGFYLLSSEISSVSNDMAVAFFTWVVLLLWIEKYERPAKSAMNNALIVLLSVFMVTVKLSSVPLLLFSVFVVMEYMGTGERKKIFVLGTMGMLFLLPWFARSIFLSGYLIFPQLQIDLFSPDWKMSRESVAIAVQGVVGIARLGNSWDPSVSLTFSEWVPRWFHRLTLNRQAMVIGAALSPILLSAMKSIKKPAISREYLLAFFIMFLGAIFWFFAAPGIRFGYGPLVALCALTVAPFLLQLLANREKVLVFFSATLIVLLAVFQLYTLWFSFDASTFRERWLLPLDYPPSVASECDLDGVTIHCRPDGILWTQCFYDVFPCATLHRLDTKMRGATFQDGFRSGISP